MKDRPLFSVRETLSAKGKPENIFQQCLLDAKQFIDANSVSDILHHAFGREENREVVKESVRSFLHVGFLSPYRNLADMGRMAEEVGFFSGFSTLTSAVVSRELGYITGCADIPTAIFTAKLGKRHEDASYVEVFLPDAQASRVRKWIEDEVGTHIGLILKKPTAFIDVQAAFYNEAFQIAPFMAGKQIDSPGREASVIYYEKPCVTGKFRIEIFSPY
ncbi:MAG: hypothetical protein HKP13_09315 [Gammaproteobacteria bacterium]|nr:hypothetical protein [Gammaproteobacteria bacterium]